MCIITQKIKMTISYSNIIFKLTGVVVLLLFLLALSNIVTYAALPIPEINITLAPGDLPEDAEFDNLGGSITLQILFITVLIALIPSILVVMTTFTRIIIVLSFLRSALGTQQMPPNQILIGIALMLTIFLMNPVISQITETAFTPFSQGEISQAEAIDLAMLPMREFMLSQLTGTDHLAFFTNLSGLTADDITTINDIPNHVLIPAFILNEITVGFAIGVMLYIPFIVIDMVVASVLMAMGMMMLPPAMISLPFKVLLFVLVDGWRLVVEALVTTFV